VAKDDEANVISSAAVVFEIFGTENTDTDEDSAKELCTADR